MNRLINKAPSYIEIEGVLYKLNTNYVDCLKCIMAMQDKDLIKFPNEIVEVLLHNIYDEIPDNRVEALHKALWFLRGGRDKGPEKRSPKIYDFEVDGEMIYSALLKQNIDLDLLYDLHWWKFLAYFSEIGESLFSRVVYLRSQKIKGKLTKEERAECDRIGWNIINMSDISEEDEIMEWLRNTD